MSNRIGILIVLLMAILVVVIGRPQYLEWREQTRLEREALDRVAAKRASVDGCRLVAKEFEIWRGGKSPSTKTTSSETEAERKVWDCILADHIQASDVAHLSGL